MAETYGQQLLEAYNRAVAEYREAVAESQKELSRMTVLRAVEYGAAYACRMDAITAAAGKVHALQQQIVAYNHFNKDDQVEYEWPDNE